MPLHKVGLSIERTPRGLGLGGYAGVLYEGDYNELNTGPYATLRAGLTYHMHDFDIGLSGTNLTNANDFKLTRRSGGIPYGGLLASASGGSAIATNAIPLAGTQFILSLTHHT